MGINPTARTCKVANPTVLRLLAEASEFAAFNHSFRVDVIRAPRLAMDEQWSYVGAQKCGPLNPEFVEICSHVAFATDSKLVVSYVVGDRSRESTFPLFEDAANRTYGITAIKLDGRRANHEAIARFFSWQRADYVQGN